MQQSLCVEREDFSSIWDGHKAFVLERKRAFTDWRGLDPNSKHGCVLVLYETVSGVATGRRIQTRVTYFKKEFAWLKRGCVAVAFVVEDRKVPGELEAAY